MASWPGAVRSGFVRAGEAARFPAEGDRNMIARGCGWLGFALALAGCAGVRAEGEPPQVLRHVVVYGAPGRFAGWPANHGMWSWGDELLVGFSRGYTKDRGPYHHIDHDQPEEFLLARSRDGGLTWSVEEP